MDVKGVIELRRSYRALDSFKVTNGLIKDLAKAACLAASCYNNQPWRYVFVYDPEALQKLHAALAEGNAWAQKASLIIAVCSKKEMDCITGGREYYLFDTGIATAQMMLRATELGLVTHAMAGFSEKKVKKVLNIPQDMRVITLIAIGKHASDYEKLLSDWQLDVERTRPERLPVDKFAFMNYYENKSIEIKDSGGE